jgi:hypothetical protein
VQPDRPADVVVQAVYPAIFSNSLKGAGMTTLDMSAPLENADDHCVGTSFDRGRFTPSPVAAHSQRASFWDEGGR